MVKPTTMTQVKILKPSATKKQLWATMSNMIDEFESALNLKRRLIVENDELKRQLVDVSQENFHYRIQLEALTEKYEDSKRSIKRYARLYADAIEPCESYTPANEAVAAEMPTWLNTLFAKFGL